MRVFRFLMILLLLLVSPALRAQTAAELLNWTRTHLDRGNCDEARETYALYKEKVPQGNAEVEHRIAECRNKINTPVNESRYVPSGYVDLGLPSGTLWKSSNESGYYSYQEAVNKYGTQLPSKGQFEELINNCLWKWTGAGYKITGTNGNTLYLPAAGYRLKNKKDIQGVGEIGAYWSSSTYFDPEEAVYLFFVSFSHHTSDDARRKDGHTVRLVRNY